MLGHVVAALLVLVDVVSIVRVVLGLLLSVYKSNSIDVVILVIVAFAISPHDQLFLRPLEPNWSHRLRSITGDIDIRHILVVLIVLS